MQKKKTILIIERETNLSCALKSILEKEGYQIISAISSSLLKELFENKQLDLAAIDIDTPKEFGLNILRKAKETFPSLPIILMTAYSNSLSKKEVERLGARDFIARPFDIGHLKKRIEELTEGKNGHQVSCIS